MLTACLGIRGGYRAWTALYGRALAHPRAARHVWRACARPGAWKYKGVYALRHYCGTRLVREGGDLEMAARHLGHASIKTTRIYIKWSDEGLKKAVGEW